MPPPPKYVLPAPLNKKKLNENERDWNQRQSFEIFLGKWIFIGKFSVAFCEPKLQKIFWLLQASPEKCPHLCTLKLVFLLLALPTYIDLAMGPNCRKKEGGTANILQLRRLDVFRHF